MKILTYNINSINARIDGLLNLLKKENPDVVLLQEIKTETKNFPFFEVESLGYQAEVLGEKSYNGVAVLCKHKMTVKEKNLPNFADEHSRYLEVEFVKEQNKYCVASLYLPNGNSSTGDIGNKEKLRYKLEFMDALYAHLQNLKNTYDNIIIGGDFNVILSEADVYDAKPFINNALYVKEVKDKLKSMFYLGYYDAYRAKYPNQIGYTFWDYTQNALLQDNGMRIDYFLLSPKLADKLKEISVDKETRKSAKPSDHAPLIAEIAE